MTTLFSPTGLRQTFDTIIGVLRAKVAARGARPNPLPSRLIVATHRWLGRTMRRFAALVARAEAGRLAPRPKRPNSNPGPRRTVRPPDPLAAPLPTGQGWLIPLLPMHAAAAGSQLQHWLAQPDTAALIEAAPTLGRMLRPLARMLAVTLPPALQLPPRARRQAPQPRRPRPAPPAAHTPARTQRGRGHRPHRHKFLPG